jgi:nucleotide-binding universal stress UspA family protein
VPKTTTESEVLKQKQACAKITDDCKAKADPMGVKALSRVVVGRAGEAIVNICESEKFDLVIMGSKGYSHLRHLVIGSVADQVVNHAVCPVLVKRRIS